MENMDLFDSFGVTMTDMLVPWLTILISIAAAFWFKEFAQNLVAGLSFKWGGNFREGDQVILDGHDAMVQPMNVDADGHESSNERPNENVW